MGNQTVTPPARARPADLFLPELDLPIDGTAYVLEAYNVSGALFSENLVYRYALWRRWERRLPPLAVVGLNPSTGDAIKDDPTIRRCVDFAERWGYGQLVMLNVFGFRSTDPKALYTVEDPVGPLNDRYIDHACALVHRAGGCILAAWGAHGARFERATHMAVRLGAEYGGDLLCLGLTKELQPLHPLMIPGATKPKPLGLGL